MSNTTHLTRRTLIGGALMLALPGWAESDFTIDWQGGPQTPEVAKSLADQIALVRGLAVAPSTMDFFRSQIITVDLDAGTKTRAGPRGIFFERRPVPADNPVLLHELIHRWQLVRMPGGVQNPTVHRFYDEARAGKLYPPDSYMMTNAFEFFAMTASVVLYGRAARPPRDRATVAARQPALYAFIASEFGFRPV